MSEHRPTALGALKAGGYRPRTVKDEMRSNLIGKLRSGEELFPGIKGYSDTVIPQIVNAVLSKHDFILLGLRGQAPRRILRHPVSLPHAAVPFLPGRELNGDHFAAAHWMLTGRLGSNTVNQDQMYPSVGSYISRVRGPNRADLPAYVGVPAAESVYLFPGYQGAAYLGAQYNPFPADMDHKYTARTSKGQAKTPTLCKAHTARKRSVQRQHLLDRVARLPRD